MPTLRPLTDAEYAAWMQEAVPAYARDKVASGAWAEGEALENAQREFEALLPGGKSTPDHHLFAVLAPDGTYVGVIWFAAQERAGGRMAYLYNIEIVGEHRRQGHAERALRALEAEVGRLGLQGIALHVFGHNTGAQALYGKLGYVPTNINMFKAVPAGA